MKEEIIDEFIEELNNNIEILTDKLNDLYAYKEFLKSKNIIKNDVKVKILRNKKNYPLKG